jgi:hypothetical protein
MQRCRGAEGQRGRVAVVQMRCRGAEVQNAEVQNAEVQSRCRCSGGAAGTEVVLRWN